MREKYYFELGFTSKGYDPKLRLEYLKNNFESIQLLNGHTLYVKLKNGETIELCDTGMSASWALSDFIVLVNEKEQNEQKK